MKRKTISLFLALTLALSLCACSTPPSGQDTKPPSDTQDADVEPPAAGQAMEGAVSCPFNMTPQAEETYPYMGVSVQLPDRLLNAILDNIVFVQVSEDVEYTDLAGTDRVSIDWRPTPDKTILHSGYLEFIFLPEGMRDRAPYRGMANPMTNDEFEVWITDGLPMARLGMYRADEFEDSMLQNTGFTNHQRLGERGNYVYYLSTNAADDGMTQEGKDIFATLTELERGITTFDPRPVDEYYFGIITPEKKSVDQVGQFQTATLDGQEIDHSVFQDAKLTMINTWTTWCGACIDEMPDLEELSQELEGTDAQIIGIAYDTYDGRGQINEELLELAQKITERTGVTFPTLIPDSNLMDGLLQGVLGFPTTWFVDSEGNVVGDPVLGSNSKDGWMQLIQERLAEVNG